MQIRLTVVDPQGQPADARTRGASCDVLVTAPAGTALAAVASALATAVGGDGQPVLYAGMDRLDPQRCTLGEPPLTDGALVSLGAPAGPGPDADPDASDVTAELHVVAGPDAGGVHLLHGGRIEVGRSADADVPLDDPDVSRLHCAVTVGADGRVTVADLGSTNGTRLDGTRVSDRPQRFAPGSLLRLGESALRLAPPGGTPAVRTAPDGEGHLRLVGDAPVPVPHARVGGTAPHTRVDDGNAPHGYAGTTPWGASAGSPGAHEHAPVEPPIPSPLVPGQAGAPRIETQDTRRIPAPGTRDPDPRKGGTPGKRSGGFTAWARRLTGGRGEEDGTGRAPYAPGEDDGPDTATEATATAGAPEKWPDPAALLLTALGPGPRLWERTPGHPEALTVRLGTADRAAPDGSGLLPAVPVTADLRETGALGLAGPRPRLAGLARAVLAQLTALHGPDTLELVLISADRARPVAERTAEWSWLGWLPHVRPAHGQDCRLLLAYDREQATARTTELLRRLDDHAAPAPAQPPAAGRRPSWARPDDGTRAEGPYTVLVVDGDPGGADVREAVARLAQEGPRAGIHVLFLAETAAAPLDSPVTRTYESACAASYGFRESGAVALLCGDVATALRLLRVAPGGANQPYPGAASPYADHDSDAGAARALTYADEITHHGLPHTPAAGIPVPKGNGTARGPVEPGAVAAVDAVSGAWAERFARALAPLRADGGAAGTRARVATPLPRTARLLDELGLARATPASLLTRWADAADDSASLGGRAWAVLGAGPRGPVLADLAAEGPHLLIEGPPGSGRTELLRTIAASLAAAERPDRLGIVLIDGRDCGPNGPAGTGDDLRVCTDLPHVTTHLATNDPVRMREFAQSLAAELKRRAELLGRLGFAEWHTQRALSGRMVPQRTTTAPTASTGVSGASGAAGAADIESPPSSTIRLRPAATRQRTEPAPPPPPLPRLVVLVDDVDVLLSPALGSPGRPSAGSVVRALEAVAREGARLGVHLIATTTPESRTAQSELGASPLRVTLDPTTTGPDAPAPGRGRLTHPDGPPTPFQAGRVTGRIPRTATLRPTVVPLEWHRAGDPPTRRPVRELGNGPTDLALLASALERAARSAGSAEVPALL